MVEVRVNGEEVDAGEDPGGTSKPQSEQWTPNDLAELSLGSGSLSGLSESLRVWSIALIFDPKFLRLLESQINLGALYTGPP